MTNKPNQSPTYEETRQAWRNIWINATFDNELKTLDYERSQEILNTYVPYLDRNKPILEAGCGMGQVVYYLKNRGYQIVGLDYAPEPLAGTKERFPDLPLHMGDVHHLPYADNTFGNVLSFGVVEHFEQGPDAALRESYRVTAPNGKLIITVPHPQFLDTLVEIKNKVMPPKVARAEYYERTFSHQELAQHVTDAGYKIELVKPVGHSYTFYGLGAAFRKPNSWYDETNGLAEMAANVSRRLLPWASAFHTLIIATKTK
jgi:SAM-dependent methyltransferase